MKVRVIAFLAWLWHFIAWIWSFLIFGTIVGILGNLASTYLTTGRTNFTDPRTSTVLFLLRSHPYRFALIILFILGITFCAYLADRNQRRVLQGAADLPVLTPSGQSRQRLLVKVHTFWITGVLEQSLHGAALIALGLGQQRDATANFWRLAFLQPDQPAKPLPPGTRISQVYDDAGGELLILGEPGSGKTTLLLELTADLLDRTRRDDCHPGP